MWNCLYHLQGLHRLYRISECSYPYTIYEGSPISCTISYSDPNSTISHGPIHCPNHPKTNNYTKQSNIYSNYPEITSSTSKIYVSMSFPKPPYMYHINSRQKLPIPSCTTYRCSKYVPSSMRLPDLQQQKKKGKY